LNVLINRLAASISIIESKIEGEAGRTSRRLLLPIEASVARVADSALRRIARTSQMTEPRNLVVRLRQFGGPEGIDVVDAPLPVPGPGEVRVRVLASGLEYTDVVIRRHLYPQTMHRRVPFVLGYDVLGEIDQLGDTVRA
jgi:hypothetical protein